MAKIPVIEQCTVSYKENKDFLVDRLEVYLEQNKNLVFPHRHNFYHMVLFLAGGGSHEIDFKEYAVERGQVYMMGPGQVHSWMFQGEMKGFIVNFDIDYFKTLLVQQDYVERLGIFSSLTESVFVLDEYQLREIINLFSQLLELNDRVTTDLQRTLLLFILLKLDQAYAPSLEGKSLDYHLVLIKNFLALLDQHFKELHLPKEYAELLFVTPNHLNAVCKEYMGLQAGEVIRNRILLEAKRLLILPDWTISQVSYELNFNDNSYFTKFFKKIAGITPEEFRRSQWK
ncbi:MULTISPECIES: helix-turn-helix domain-containing protein [Sphingobacterium]|uniref:Helix-turn-helix transcriptional regulator n=1 Tax=Sphingobacterium tenebrionis TaxID=3111775 RepID=A0ABU8I255_9SPHI|nr:helix-turn-helix transcriptional regulator [Sphingobacterium sp. CZ-2]